VVSSPTLPNANKRAEIHNLNTFLEQRVVSARPLEAANKELEAFSYTVSHDLRGLGAMDGFSQAMQEIRKRSCRTKRLT